MRKLFLIIFSFFAIFFITGCVNEKIKYHKPVIRDVSLINEQIDYQSFFNDFTKQEVILDKNKNTIQFKATKEMDASLFEEIDFVNYSSNKNKVEFDYDVNYDANTNEFTLSIKANTEKGTIIDNWQGTPFIDEKGQTDIAFATDDGVVYLSELEDSSVINKCGWFSRLFRKIAKVAAIVAVVAVVVAVAVVAAPVAAAAGTAFATVAASGGVAVLAGGSAATAMAVAAGTAVASTAFVVAGTTFLAATTTALISGAIAGLAHVIEYQNSKVSKKEKWTTQELKKALVKAIVVTERGKNRNTVIYLGRLEDYKVVTEKDDVNNVIKFYMPFHEWEKLENKYTKEGMWILNRAFLDFGINGEKTKNWKFRLATNHHKYPTPRPSYLDGYFYSMELDYLRKTGHYFSKNRTTKGYYSVYAR